MVIQTLKCLGLAAVAATLFLTPAFATNVSYTTTGSFSNCTGAFHCVGDITEAQQLEHFLLTCSRTVSQYYGASGIERSVRHGHDSWRRDKRGYRGSYIH